MGTGKCFGIIFVLRMKIRFADAYNKIYCSLMPVKRSKRNDMKKLMLLLVAGTMLMASSCTKTGPVGPQGPTGNANVIGENPFTVSTWLLSGTTFYQSFDDANITTDVANYGLVEIYKYYSTSGWTNLPDIDGDVSTVYNFYPGGFTISILMPGGTPPNPGSVEFRVVVVPSSVRLANPNTNWKNYEETKAVLAKYNLSATGRTVTMN